MFWILLLGALFAGYLTLAARDYGPALLGDRGPFDPRFLGRQVWLVAAAGLLFGAFPALEGELLARHAAVVTPALAGTVVATVAIPLRRRRLAALGSATAAAGWGGLLGALLTAEPAGIAALAAVQLALTATQGAALRADPRNTARLALLTLSVATAALVVLPFFSAVRVGTPTAYPGLLLIVVLIGLLAVTAHAARRHRWRPARAAITVSLALPVPIVSLLTWPYALIPGPAPGAGATWEHALADPATLRLLALVALPALPLAVLALWAGKSSRRSQVEGHSPEFHRLWLT
ncbi:cytochrome d ubiquinol oxidase subunit II [Catenuloplanes atrovinosus]|uniref:Cytochrome d ubiquinol oxidase subunit II n=1 Tax=Catenuloplanes atrovinosus TaxID=137266 RepID=A0AAE4CDQ8_9ACTN|nr:cytochrome d ubiquinol oxidase subunit II [Catenuloplanes atrovinosus]MDR7280707.1 cytochrome d ubiquinol oxidase subunit II [Catenuloplanes atrovinosus]